MVQAALRRRRGRLHRRPRLHPALRLPVAVGQAHRRSAEGRSGRGDRQFLRRLRQLRRGRPRPRCSARPSTAPTSSTIRRGWDRLLARLRGAVIGWLQRRRDSAPHRLRRMSGADDARREPFRRCRSDRAARRRHPGHGRPGRRRAGRLDRRARRGAMAGPRSRPRCRASRSAPARRSTTSRCCRRATAARRSSSLMPTPGRCRCRDGGGVHGGRPLGAARPGHARPHHADRLDPPRLRRRREGEAGRRHRRSRGRGRRGRLRRASAPSPSTWRRWPERNGSVISAAMFGALAGAQAAAVSARTRSRRRSRAGGKGVEPSLARLRAPPSTGAAIARDRAVTRRRQERFDALPAAAGHPALDRLVARIAQEFPAARTPCCSPGVKRLVDFQDPAYARRVSRPPRRGCTRVDRRWRRRGKGFAFTQAAAKYVAVAMAYDDVIRVADLKVARHALRARARGSRRRPGPDRLHDRIHASAHGGGLRHAADGARRLDRGAAAAVRAARPAGQPRPARAHRARSSGSWRFYVVSALRRMRRGTLRHAARDGASRRLARARGRHAAEQLRSRRRGPAHAGGW